MAVGAGLLLGTLAVWPGHVVSQDEAELVILEPREGAMVMGTTRFRFAVPLGCDSVGVFVNDALIGRATAPEWTLEVDLGEGPATHNVLAVAWKQDRTLAKITRIISPAVHGEYERVDLVQLYPVIRSRSTGRYITHFTKNNFEVFEDGTPVPIRYFSSRAESLTMSLVLDTSESMTGKLGPLLVAASNFVDELEPSDRVAAYAFNHGLRRLAEHTSDKERIRDRLWDLTPAGGTALFDSLIRVIEDLSEIPGRKAIFIFSDGLDRMSVATLQDAVRAALENNVLIYATAEAKDDPTLTARQDLRTLARRTGGLVYFIRGPRRLNQIFASILEDLRAQYVLEYPPRQGEEGTRAIDVRLRGTSIMEREKITLRYRENYVYRRRNR